MIRFTTKFLAQRFYSLNALPTCGMKKANSNSTEEEELVAVQGNTKIEATAGVDNQLDVKNDCKNPIPVSTLLGPYKVH